MSKCKLLVLWFALTILPAAMIGSQLVQVSRKQVDDYADNSYEKYASPDSMEWKDRMYRALADQRDVDAAAETLAREDSLSSDNEKALISLWITYSEVRRGVGEAKDREARERLRQSLRHPSFAVVQASGYALLTVQIAAKILIAVGRCELEDFDALLDESAKALEPGLTAATEADCALWWLALDARFPKNRVIMAELSSRENDVALAVRLSLLEQLNASREPVRETRVNLMEHYVGELWRGGLIDEGLAQLASASADDRALLLNDQSLPQSLVLDGVSVETGEDDRGRSFAERQNDFRLDYIAALFVSGRTDEARSEFERLPYTHDLRLLWDCPKDIPRGRRNPADRCDGAQSALISRWSLLESALNRGAEDPYLLIEGGPAVDSRSALWVEAARQRLTGDNYEPVRRGLAESWTFWNLGSRNPELDRLTKQLLESDLQLGANAFEQKMRASVAAWNVNTTVEAAGRTGRGNATPPPLPDGFRELPLPQNLPAQRSDQPEAGKWPADASRLPDGFAAVRLERGSSLTVAVSLSQNLDPVGEVSGGAYWIHVSRDSGASWEAPLYTGLLEYFPYVVLATSRMPLWTNDRITMEVAVQEIDPASITYPPIALQSRRRASDLYLEIPLAALQADHDSDGVTDIVEEHLLLNPNAADSDGDGIEDGRDPLPNVNDSGASSGNSHMAKVLQQIYQTPQDAIIEPVDRNPDALRLGKRGKEPGATRPRFVLGNPSDFAGLRLTSPLLVYGDADVERLRAHSLDFHALSLGPVIFNRAHDRGYLSWSEGWRGGTLRLIREGEIWRVEAISSWIT